MNNKFRILYLKDESSQNSEFIKYLVKNYNAQVYSYVLPNIIESRLGHLDFSTLKDFYDIDWNEAIQNINSKDDITFDFGFDFYGNDPDSVAFEFRKCLMHYFDSLNFKYTNKTKIKKIVSSINKSKKFIRENDIFKYDLIIIENLATNISEPLKSFKGRTKYSPTSSENLPLYTQYKITPNLLNRVLNSNSRLLLLMDYDYNSFHLMNESLIRYKKMMQRIGICNFELADKSIDNYFAKNPELFVGIDFEKRINDTLCEFSISLDDKYKQSIPERLSQYYNNVSNIHVNYPIQLTTDSKNNIKANSKILLSGNNETTILYPKWNNEIYDDIKRHEILINNVKVKKPKGLTEINFRDNFLTQSKELHNIRKLKDIKHLNDFDCASYYEESTYFNKLPPKESIFAVADILYNSTYLMLSGHIFSDNFINKKKCGNKKFASNIIEFMTSQVDLSLDLKKEYLPKIRMEIDTGKVFVSFEIENELTRETEINLTNREFCYYRYFLDKATHNLSFVSVADDINSEYNKDINKYYKYLRISSNLIKDVIDYYGVSFPDSQSFDRTIEKFTKDKRTSEIKSTFIPIVHDIKKAFNLKLKNILSKRLIDLLIISSKNISDDKLYGIKLPADNIKILQPNKNVDII